MIHDGVSFDLKRRSSRAHQAAAVGNAGRALALVRKRGTRARIGGQDRPDIRAKSLRVTDARTAEFRSIAHAHKSSQAWRPLRDFARDPNAAPVTPFPSMNVRSTLLLRGLRLSCALLVSLCGQSLSARLFEPQAIPAKLGGGCGDHRALRVSPGAYSTGVRPDLLQKQPAGKIQGTWNLISLQEIQPTYPAAAKNTPVGGSKIRSLSCLPRVRGADGGAFSVDVYLRSGRGGLFLKAGGIPMGLHHRGPGQLMVRVPVKGADGKETSEALVTDKTFTIAPALRHDDFYVYSLTYDGAKTFAVLIDGRPVFKSMVAEGNQVAKRTAEAAVGDVENWTDLFSGEIAAVRFSRGVRQYTPPADTPGTFQKQSDRGWTFDPGPATSPVYPGAIPLRADEAYSPARGYGWLGPVVGDFDAPGVILAAGYVATPERAGIKTGSIPSGGLDAARRCRGHARAPFPSGCTRRPILGDRGGRPQSRHFRHRCAACEWNQLGRKLSTSSNTYKGQPNDRTARGLVTASGGQGISIEGLVSDGKSKVPIREITIMPYAPLPIAGEGYRLVWKGAGKAPAGSATISASLAAGDFASSISAARKLPDLFLQACALECILGVPHYAVQEDIATAAEVRQIPSCASSASSRAIGRRAGFSILPSATATRCSPTSRKAATTWSQAPASNFGSARPTRACSSPRKIRATGRPATSLPQASGKRASKAAFSIW